MNALMIIVMGIISIVGIVWQVAIIKKDNDNDYSVPDFFENLFEGDIVYAFENLHKRLIPSIILGAIILVGTIVWMIIVLLVDSNSEVTSDLAFGILIKVVVLVLAFNFKSYFGPLVVCFVATVSVYNIFEYGFIEYINLLQPLIDWIFDYFPVWIKYTYWVIFLLNSALTSLYEVFDNN